MTIVHALNHFLFDALFNETPHFKKLDTFANKIYNFNTNSHKDYNLFFFSGKNI